MVYDGHDIHYFLKKKGYSLTDVAHQLGVSPQNIYQIIHGICVSKRVTEHIEELLGFAPGILEISREKRDELIKVA